MTRFIAVLVLLASSTVCQAGLLANFANSFATYQACSALMPASKCFKLYCDPEGILEGRIRAFIEVPLSLSEPGASRFDFGLENGVKSTHPAYSAFQSGNAQISKSLTHERYEIAVQFSAIGEPPGGELILFEYHVHDATPERGLGTIVGNEAVEIRAGFEFDPGDFITIFTPGTPPVVTTFDDTQLQDVLVPVTVPEPGATVLFVTGAVALNALRRRRQTR